ncbi:MAG: DMT family transporter [Candidatus Jacksonbacteria bacterium]|nr:DMT family transporter [Candidatus Jacksonbacteria bacterium]
MSKKHIVLIFGTAAISGFSIFLNSYAVQLANPNAYTFAKNLVPVFIASTLLFLPKSRHHFKNISARDWLYLAFIGIIGGGVAFILFFNGLAKTSPGMGSFIHKTLFIWIALGALMFLKETVKPFFFVAALALLAGNFLLLGVKFNTLTVYHFLILGATLLWATENVLAKYVLNKGISPLIVIWSRMTFGALAILVYLAATHNLFSPADFSKEVLLWILITGVMLTGYVFTWYYGMSRAPVTLASTILLLGSPITMGIAALFQGKTIAPLQAGGILLIVLSVGAIVYLFSGITREMQKRMAQNQIAKKAEIA